MHTNWYIHFCFTDPYKSGPVKLQTWELSFEPISSYVGDSAVKSLQNRSCALCIMSAKDDQYPQGCTIYDIIIIIIIICILIIIVVIIIVINVIDIIIVTIVMIVIIIITIIVIIIIIVVIIIIIIILLIIILSQYTQTSDY